MQKYGRKTTLHEPLTLLTGCTHGRRKDFSQGGGKSGQISFYPLETKKTTIFTEHLKRKCQNYKSRRGQPGPLPAPMRTTYFEYFCLLQSSS